MTVVSIEIKMSETTVPWKKYKFKINVLKKKLASILNGTSKR